MNVIEMDNVKKTLGNFTLDIPHLAIKEGYITGFIGQNGSGKTTTLKLIMNLLKLDGGQIKVFGKDVATESKQIHEQIGFVGEPTGYMTEATLEQTKQMIAPFYKTWDDALFNKYVKAFQLDTSKKIKELSQGQNKQAALIMALSHRPKLILLDEATANLDPVIRAQILDILMEHMQSEEVSVFYSTHITSDLDKASDYVVMMNNGKVVLYEDKETLDSKYLIIKGPKKALNDTLEKELIGIQKNAFGFEGLARLSENMAKTLGNELICEKANIEDIMIFTQRGSRK